MEKTRKFKSTDAKTATDHREHSPHLCVKCGCRKPYEGGKWVISADGLRQKWVCKDCNRD